MAEPCWAQSSEASPEAAKAPQSARSSTRSDDLISFGAGGLVSVMERGVGEVSRRQYEYKLLATVRESTTQKELSEALARGYKFIEISSFAGNSIIERLIVLGRIKEATAEAK